MNIKNDLRILQLGKFYPIRGGVEKVAYNLMCGLSERGIRCDMMCAAIEGGNREIRVNDNARLLLTRTLVKAAATMISPDMITALRRVCHDYDIVHIHHPDPMACLALWLSGYRGPVVLHWHSDILKQRFLLRFYKPLQDWLLRRAAVVVGTSPVYLAESPFLDGVQNKSVSLPIGVQPVSPSPEGVEAIRSRYPGRKIVFALGRLVPYKGFHYLVEAARRLDDSYVVLIGGTGPMRDTLQADIDAAGLQERVRLLGYVSKDDLPSYYGACTLFCMSSIYKTEAFGIVQIEAMSCDKPVVATRIPQSGVGWVNADGESGLNVDPCDAAGLAEAIRAVTADETTYRRYCEGAHRRYEQLFTRERMIDGCLKIYADMLALAGRQR